MERLWERLNVRSVLKPIVHSEKAGKFLEALNYFSSSKSFMILEFVC